MKFHLIAFSLIQPYTCDDSFFTSCDRNNDRRISEVEFTLCSQSLIGSDSYKAEYLLKIMDSDKDGYISPSEYRDMLADFFERSKNDKREATLTDRFGNTQTITMQDLFARSEANFAEIKGRGYKNNNIVQDINGEASASEEGLQALAAERPEIARSCRISLSLNYDHYHKVEVLIEATKYLMLLTIKSEISL